MSRKLVIDGNAVYEIDEDCMLRRRLDHKEETDGTGKERRNNVREQKKDTNCSDRISSGGKKY